MITGFNTDIDYNGVTYHVQTEDKGLDTPLILSLVYNRGTILASKRSPYDDLLIGKFDEKELAERLNRQHKLICAAIKAGRIDDLAKMTAKAAAQRQTNGTAASQAKTQEIPAVPPPVEPAVEVPVPPVNESPAVELRENVVKPVEQKETFVPPVSREEKVAYGEPIRIEKAKEPAPIAKPEMPLPVSAPPLGAPELEPVWDAAPIEITDADLIFDDTQNLENIVVLSDADVEIISDFSEQVAPDDFRLFIELLNEVKFKGGESKTISVLVGRGNNRLPLVGANIMIKVLGASFRPLIFHTKTDSNGVAIVNLQLPAFSRGRAAVLIKVMDNGEEAEIRRVISPN